MAVQWRWNEKCGEAVFLQRFDGRKDVQYTTNLYVGNAYLIFIREWEEDGSEKYALKSFWADKEHMLNCLGLKKKSGCGCNIYDSEYNKLIKIRIDKKKCRYYKQIIQALAEAFDSLEIELYTEDEEK